MATKWDERGRLRTAFRYRRLPSSIQNSAADGAPGGFLLGSHEEVVGADLSDYFGQIPHADLLRSIARRVSDGRLLGWVKA